MNDDADIVNENVIIVKEKNKVIDRREKKKKEENNTTIKYLEKKQVWYNCIHCYYLESMHI
jgi:hypothetical protein